ncbi:hypothetical protein [Atlantibacter sp.]|nr:hypothetical protein [Atlantibacter sp.]
MRFFLHGAKGQTAPEGVTLTLSSPDGRLAIERDAMADSAI